MLLWQVYYISEVLEGGVKMNENNILCASTGGSCNGVCRETNLHRKREWSDPEDFCPSAYGEGIHREKKKISKKK